MRILGILNVTPDSFSDGGRYDGVQRAVEHARRLHAEGADLVDVGGESTRPGAAEVDEEEERRRVIPVVRAIAGEVPVSVDTRRAAIAAEALDLGAVMVNDVSGGEDPAMLPLVARAGCAYVLMHRRGTPATMDALAVYDDVVTEVWAALETGRARALDAGVAPDRLWLDPGIGFAKTTAHNLALLRDLPARCAVHQVLLGASRKRFLGELTGEPVPDRRLEGSLAVALWARRAGVALLRVHDVASTRRALAVWDAIGGPA